MWPSGFMLDTHGWLQMMKTSITHHTVKQRFKDTITSRDPMIKDKAR